MKAKKFRKYLVYAILLWLLIPIGLREIPNVSASPAWLTGWSYRKGIIISSASGAGTHYQIGVKTYYGSGTDGTETVNSILMAKVYLDENCRPDFGDIRFTDNDETTELDYWMEEYTNATSAVFWVEVADSLSSTYAIIFLYYGKSDATTTSNGVNTFVVFDHFDDASLDAALWDWSALGGGSVTEHDTYLDLTTDSVTGFRAWAVTDSTYAEPLAVESYVNTTNNDGSYSHAGMITTTIPDIYDIHKTLGYRHDYDQSEFRYQSSDGASSTIASYTTSRDTNWHRTSTKRLGTTVPQLAIENEQVNGTHYTNANKKIFFYCNPAFNTAETMLIDWVALRRYVYPEPLIVGVINIEVTITNMETNFTGETNWLFAEERYYNFEAKVESVSSLDTVTMAFSDGQTWINATWDAVEDEWIHDTGDNVTVLQRGSNSTVLLQTTVVFPIYLKETILDALNVDIWMYANNTEGWECAWSLGAVDYFNIYNLGGFGEILSSGTAGRTSGGDIFELYAQNQSWIAVNQTWRKLQHYHSQFAFYFYDTVDQTGEDEYMQDQDHSGGGAENYANKGDWVLDISIYYVDPIGDVWVDGWMLRLQMQEGDEGDKDEWITLNASWYQRGTYISSDNFNAFIEEDPKSQFRIWLDLWFNKVNASSTVGGRINAYYYGMQNVGWLGSLYSDWAPILARATNATVSTQQSMFFEDLQNSTGGVISSKQLDLMKIGFNLSRPSTAVDKDNRDWRIILRDFDLSDIQTAQKDMEGVDTPILVETKVPDMPQTGFLAALWGAMSGAFNWVVEALGPAMLGFWDAFVGFIDSIFSWLGYPNAFSEFLNLLTNVWLWFVDSVSYVVTMLVQGFLFMTEWMEKFISLIVTVFTQLIAIVQGIWNMLDTGFGMATNVWDTLDIGTWVIIGVILYPIFLLAIWDEEGTQALSDHISFVLNIFAFFIKGFITLITLAIQVIDAIIEKIPIIE